MQCLMEVYLFSHYNIHFDLELKSHKRRVGENNLSLLSVKISTRNIKLKKIGVCTIIAERW